MMNMLQELFKVSTCDINAHLRTECGGCFKCHLQRLILSDGMRLYWFFVCRLAPLCVPKGSNVVQIKGFVEYLHEDSSVLLVTCYLRVVEDYDILIFF
jgi:hypothetical protein